MRKITSILSLFLLLIMGSTTALADDYTVKKLKTINDTELQSVDHIQDGQTYVLMFTYRGVYLQYNVLNGNWNGVNTLSSDVNNSSLAVVTFHKKTVEGDENAYYTLEAANGYYFKSYSEGENVGIEASASPTLFQVVSGGTEDHSGQGYGKTCFFIKPKDGTEKTYMTLNNGNNNAAFGYGNYGFAHVALFPVTTEGTVTNYEVTFALKEGDNTLSTSTSRAWDGETADVSAINNYSTALFDLTQNYDNSTVSSTNKNFTCTLTPKADAPVVLSSADSRKWYSLQTRKSVYDAGQLVADGNNVKCHGAGFNTTDIASYEQFENGLWSFEQSGGGVKIYNKGKQQYLKTTGTETSNQVIFDATGTVFYMGSASTGTFNLNTGNAQSYVGSHNTSTNISGRDYTGVYLSVWTDDNSHNDPGSTFTPTSVDNETILAIGKTAFSKTPERSYTENGVLKKGCYDAAAKESVSAATSFADMETRVNAAAANVSPEEGVYYLIRNVNKGGYGTETENYKKYLTTAEITCDTNGDVQASVNGQSIGLGIKRLRGTSAFVPRLWKFEKTADGKYNLLNANTNSYVNVANMLTKDNQGQKDAYVIYTTEDAFGDGYDATNDSTTMFVMSSSNSTGDKLLNAANGYNYDTYEGVGTWHDNADAGNYWQFIKVTEVPLPTIKPNDYNTLCLPFNVKLPEGSTVKAYYASQAAGKVLKLEEITDGIIPANQGVILQNTDAAEATINLAITTESGTSFDNKLVGVTAKRAGYTAGTNYVLAEKSGNVGFYKANFTTIVANKAYLPQDNVQNAQGVMMAFGFGDEVTGIDNVNAAAPAAKKYYDLQGRRVLYPAKGIFVTEDGQKVLLK